LVEQNAAESLRIADHGYVLETGAVVLAGKGGDLMNDEKVKQSYLGA
jgi:branched-chain amino acid transport system ATP-binding protein